MIILETIYLFVSNTNLIVNQGGGGLGDILYPPNPCNIFTDYRPGGGPASIFMFGEDDQNSLLKIEKKFVCYFN